MNILSKLFRQTNIQDTRLFISNLIAPKLTPQQYEALAREGYQDNPIVYACTQKISNSLKTIEWQLLRKDSSGEEVEIKVHPILDLLAEPNRFQTFDDFLESYVVHLTLDGDIFTFLGRDGTNNDGKTKELTILRPDLVDIIFNIHDPINPIERYEYRNGRLAMFRLDEILHIKNFNPLDRDANLGRGQSTISAVARSADQNNAGRNHNISLLQNGATPSGIIESKEGGLTKEQAEEMAAQYNELNSGTKNAGKTAFLGNATYTRTALSPKEMDWLKGIEQSSREICEGLGVPSILVGDPSAKTFNNYKEAKKALYTDTVIPLATKIVNAVNQQVLRPEYGDEFRFKLNLDSIEAIRDERMQLFEQIKDATFLTENEKRESLGFDHIEGGDIHRIPLNLVDIPVGESIEPLDGDDEDGE